MKNNNIDKTNKDIIELAQIIDNAIFQAAVIIANKISKCELHCLTTSEVEEVNKLC